MILIGVVFGGFHLALLSVLAEISGRLKASTLRAEGRDLIRTRKFHRRLYFVLQLVAGPLLIALMILVLG